VQTQLTPDTYFRMLCVRMLLSLAVLNCIHPRTWGQVTFSKDWNAGKRSPADLQCNAILKSAEEFCKVLVVSCTRNSRAETAFLRVALLNNL
jgi:hypothetical protein